MIIIPRSKKMFILIKKSNSYKNVRFHLNLACLILYSNHFGSGESIYTFHLKTKS